MLNLMNLSDAPRLDMFRAYEKDRHGLKLLKPLCLRPFGDKGPFLALGDLPP